MSCISSISVEGGIPVGLYFARCCRLPLVLTTTDGRVEVIVNIQCI